MRRSKAQRWVESATYSRQLTYKGRKRDRELFQRCVSCPNTVDDGHACCQDCRRRMAQGKQQAREQGMCLDCWTAPAVPGRRYQIPPDFVVKTQALDIAEVIL